MFNIVSFTEIGLSCNHRVYNVPFTEVGLSVNLVFTEVEFSVHSVFNTVYPVAILRIIRCGKSRQCSGKSVPALGGGEVGHHSRAPSELWPRLRAPCEFFYFERGAQKKSAPRRQEG